MQTDTKTMHQQLKEIQQKSGSKSPTQKVQIKSDLKSA